MKPLLCQVLKQNKLEFPWKQPETLKGEERTKVSMEMHLFIYFGGSSSPLPLQTSGCHLNERFKLQRELRTIFDRSEEGTKYSSPVKEMYSIIFLSPLPFPIWAISPFFNVIFMLPLLYSKFGCYLVGTE